MKLLILLASVLFSAQIFACSCDYDYGSRDDKKIKRMAKLVGVADFKQIQILDYDVRPTALAVLDPYNYGRQCSCTSFVKSIWDIAYNKDDKACTAKAINNEWNNKMKVKDIDCK